MGEIGFTPFFVDMQISARFFMGTHQLEHEDYTAHHYLYLIII